MFAFLSGWRIYAIGGLLLAFLAVGGYAAYERQSALAATAQRDQARAQRDDLANKLVQSEIDKAELTKLKQELDAAIVERDRRMKELDDAKQRISRELAQLRNTLPPEDQGCFDRPLPPGVVAFLLDGTDNGHEASAGASPGKPAAPLP